MDELQRTRTAISEPPASASGVDGRVLRGARTKGRIVQALLDLVTDGLAADQALDDVAQGKVIEALIDPRANTNGEAG